MFYSADSWVVSCAIILNFSLFSVMLRLVITVSFGYDAFLKSSCVLLSPFPDSFDLYLE